MITRALACLLAAINIISVFAADREVSTTFGARNGYPSSAQWPPITRFNKPWTYWWWMGSAVNPADITRELERFAAAGVGGVHIIPIYGAKGYETQYIDYLSPKWMEMLKHTVTEANRLGMGVDMTTGTGWCFGGPTVTEQDAVATLGSKVYDVKPGERFKQKFPDPLQAILAAWPNGTQYDLTGELKADGSIDWLVPAGDQPVKVYAIWQRVTKSGNKVKRSAPGGAGYMINPFSTDAITHYLQWFDKPFADYTGPRPRSMYHDSYEYQVNWSADLLAEFKNRRGYRLEFHLPELLGTADDEKTARLKCDYRETVSDMMVDGLAKHWVDWSHAHGFITRYQAHGSPGNLLDLYGTADIPETEMFHNDADPLVAKFASSAAHVMGHPLVSSETGTWMDEHFNETLAEYKHLVDLMFVSGVNHVFYHGACYSPEDAGWPGWHFYAATEMNSRNAFWHDVPAFNAYVARCQAVLQSGHPESDVLLYWPIHDLWSKSNGMVQNLVVHKTQWLHDERVGTIATKLQNNHCAFDYISDRQIQSLKVGLRGRVVAPGGTYGSIVVPATKYMPVKTLEKLIELAEEGAQVILVQGLASQGLDDQIKDVPGLADLDGRRQALAAAKSKLHFVQGHSPFPSVATVGKGRFYLGSLEHAVAEALQQIDRGHGDLAPALANNFYREPELRMVRRADDVSVTYFVCNTGKHTARAQVGADHGGSLTLMDPMTGRIGRPAQGAIHATGNSMSDLTLEPGQSIFLRVTTTAVPDLPDWPDAFTAGEPVPLPGPWQVKFLNGGPELPKSFEAGKLESWTKNGDPETERFAGTASYAITFNAPGGRVGPWRLDLGKVCESAHIRLNGQDMGTVFAPPFVVTVDALKPMGNVLEVEVTNLSANRIRDLDRRGVKWKTFNDANVVNIDYKPFDASNWPIRDSGLLGPVKLIPISNEPPSKP